MRRLAILILVAAGGEAHASSFVSPAPVTEKISASMIVLGTPAPVAQAAPAGSEAELVPPLAYPLGSLRDPAGADLVPQLAFPLGTLDGPVFVEVSPSIIAMREPAVTNETVASVAPEPRRQRRSPPPVVIRGGLIGDAFATPTPAGGVQSPAAEQPAPSPEPKPGDEPRSIVADRGRETAGSGAPADPRPPAEPVPPDEPSTPLPSGPVLRAPE